MPNRNPSEITFDVPNLDCASVDPNDYEEFAAVLDKIKDYSKGKALSMSFRMAGNISMADDIERHCGRIYGSLPKWAQW